MLAVLHTLTDRKELLTNEIYLLSAVTALQRVTETLPHFISPYLQDITSQVSDERLHDDAEHEKTKAGTPKNDVSFSAAV